MGPELHPPTLRPPGSRSHVNSQAINESNNGHRLVWGLLGFVFVLALVVLVGLPYIINENSEDKPGSEAVPKPGKPVSSRIVVAPIPTDTLSNPAATILAPPDTVSTSANTTSVPSDTDSDLPDSPSSSPSPVSVARHDAELALQSFLRMRGQPELANAGIWAANRWSQSIETAANGDDHYGHGRFGDAQLAYEDATRQLTSLQAERPQYLADSLSRGWQALQNNDVEASRNAFENALAIQPDLGEAKAGLARARVRQELLALMEDGQEAEVKNSLQIAADAYSAALQLDPTYSPAQTALQRINETLTRVAFQQAMSNALQSLETGNLNAAESALGIAAKINPHAPAVKDARQRLNTVRRQMELNSLRLEAEQRSTEEQWSAAANLYKKALTLDPQAAYARSGLNYAQERLRLHGQFDHYLNDLVRLWSDEPLTNANKLLEANKHIPEKEPRLAAKAITLGEATRLAALPVNLIIRSDSLTEVTIYHVGRLGKFDQKAITLRPGRYTVVGSRPGYRDVREVITLSHSNANPAVLVRCEEQI